MQRIRTDRGRDISLALMLWSLAAGSANAQIQPPFDLAKSGYKLVFDDEFNSLKTIDMAESRDPGFNWYRGAFFGRKATQAADITISNGILTLTDPDVAQIATAAPLHAGPGWTGNAFGGGFYIEARIAFQPAPAPAKHAHPAFWSMAIEHLQGTAAGTYEHFIEDDFFEDDTRFPTAPKTYGGAMHDWYGVYRQTCPAAQFCDIANDGMSAFDNFRIQTQASTDFRQFHVYGELWVPASNHRNGFVQYDFDNAATTDRVTWALGSFASPAPFGIIDRDHLVIILGTGSGEAMHVDWVRLWQIPAQADDETR